MKKMFLLLIISLIGMMPLLADNDKAITRNELPEQAQCLPKCRLSNFALR